MSIQEKARATTDALFAKAAKRIEELTAERDRYRVALQEIQAGARARLATNRWIIDRIDWLATVALNSGAFYAALEGTTCSVKNCGREIFANPGTIDPVCGRCAAEATRRG